MATDRVEMPEADAAVPSRPAACQASTSGGPPRSQGGVDPLAGSDLNLLVVLHALLEERHVTRAGNRVGLSQPATSNALKRLRHMFGDPLLTKVGNEMVLSPRAFDLQHAVEDALTAVRVALRSSMPFDPETTVATIRIDSSDYALLRILPGLQAELQRSAPGIALRIEQHPANETLNRLRSDRVDLAVGPFAGTLPVALHKERLLVEHLVCAMRVGHPALEPDSGPDDVISLERLLAYSHLRVPSTGTTTGVVVDALARRHMERRVALEFPNVLLAPFVLAGTDLIAFLPRPLVEQFAATVPIVARRAPMEIDPVSTDLVWHTRSDHDPTLVWVRERAIAAAGALA